MKLFFTISARALAVAGAYWWQGVPASVHSDASLAAKHLARRGLPWKVKDKAERHELDELEQAGLIVRSGQTNSARLVVPPLGIFANLWSLGHEPAAILNALLRLSRAPTTTEPTGHRLSPWKFSEAQAVAVAAGVALGWLRVWANAYHPQRLAIEFYKSAKGMALPANIPRLPAPPRVEYARAELEALEQIAERPPPSGAEINEAILPAFDWQMSRKVLGVM